MNNTKFINTPVSVTAIGFGPGMRAYPKQMEWAGRTYQFIDRGIRVVTRRGETTMSTVTLSDGQQNFCLTERSGAWTLVGVI